MVDSEDTSPDTEFEHDLALHQAAECIILYSSLDDLRMLLAGGLDLDHPLEHGKRLIHLAVMHRHTEAIQLLLVRGASLSLMDDKGYTPLHYAAEIGFCNVIRILLKYSARVDFTKITPGDIEYCYPPKASPAEEPLRLALKNGYFKAAELLLKNGANPNAKYYSGYEINFLDPLDIEAVELLLRFGADPNARDRQGITLLMKACRSAACLPTVKLLLAYGADVNATTPEEQRTPLHCAVLSGSIETVRLLVENGASIKLSPYYTKPPPFFFAVLKSDLNMMRYLIDTGVDVNHGSAVVGSALHVALTELADTKEKVVQFLLENGADPNATLQLGGRTILKPPIGEYFASTSNPNINIVQSLLKYGSRIVLLGQRQHPLGILHALHNIDSRTNVLDLVASAAECFSISLIDSSVLLSKRHKLVLLQKALEPLSLKHCARVKTRKCLGFGPRMVSAVQGLPIPETLKQYLLFEDW